MKIDGYLIGPFNHAGFDVGHVLFTKDFQGEKDARPFVFVGNEGAEQLQATIDAWMELIRFIHANKGRGKVGFIGVMPHVVSAGDLYSRAVEATLKLSGESLAVRP